MSNRDALEGMVALLKRTAHAHHEATGGVNASWAEWYAKRMSDDLKIISGKAISVDELSSWLAAADRRYQAESPRVSWPRAYASWFLEED